MKVFEKINNPVTHIVCYSGGHSSAKVAMNVAKFMREEDSLVLLNHDINPNVEHWDIKRFKKDVSDALNTPITFANYKGIESCEDIPDQFDVAQLIGGFKFGNGTELCTHRLKTEPFQKYLEENFPVGDTGVRDDVVIYYGFDADETKRIQRRSSILGQMGYMSDYPLALWEDADHTIVEDAGILPPLTYKVIDDDNTYGAWKHANCMGCLKAGKQHWYATYVARPDLFEKAKRTEEIIGYSIIRGVYLDELEEVFAEMKQAGIPATEHIDGRKFWAMVRKVVDKGEDLDAIFEGAENEKPCECVF